MLSQVAVRARLDPVLLFLLPSLLVFGLWHLDRYPRTWFDEGMYLQVAKNFASDGLYAVRSADGTVDYAPIIGVGPTVLMLAAAAFRVGGVALEVARVIPFLALLAATLLLYRIARALFGRPAAACTLLLLVAMPALDWLATGRQLLGEVPAVALLLAGGAIAWRARGRAALVAGGVVLGLVLMTKGQYLLILPTAICAIALFDRAVTRQRPLGWYAVLLVSALLTYAAWFVTLLTFLNEGQIAENFRQLRASSGGALLVFDLDRVLSALKFLAGPRGFLLIVPATVYGLWLTWRASEERCLALATLWIFQTLWLGWFAFASIAWPRYAFPALAINTIFMGALVVRWGQTVRSGLLRREQKFPAAFGAILLVCFVLLVVRGTWSALAPLARADQREPQRFAREVERIVPAGVAIDGWEPEIGFLVDRPIQHPPLGSLDRVVRARWLGTRSGQPAALDLSGQLGEHYLMVGPFARWVGVYNTAIASPNYRLVARVGEYELYRRESGAAHTAPGSGAP
jgi:4-amino-4-deoxy-L-arabinose transferase-like glycosyltransferase